MARLFFSYSHRDEELRDELEVHLSMLKRQGFIEAWHDRRIGAGDEIDSEISQELDRSDIVLLLISPYFIASKYCYDIEMMRAMERHEAKLAHVIPIILHPCDWHPAPFGKLLAVPTDGKPVSKHPNIHDAFLDIVTSIRNTAAKFVQATPDNIPVEVARIPSEVSSSDILPRSSNLRIKKNFTEQQKDDFTEQTFEYISNFFEGSLSELEERNIDITSKFKRIDSTHFSAVVYRDGTTITQCKIWLGGRRGFSGGIAYSNTITSFDNTFNDSMSVESDGHTLYLKAMGMSFLGGNTGTSSLSKEGAAEYFWEVFIRPLQ
jgi:hypothetical protein